MTRLYKSTRGNQQPIDFYTAILQGIAHDGGLLVPDFDFTKLDISKLTEMDYVDLATEVISCFTPENTKEEIRALAHDAYATGLFDDGIVPVKKAGNVYVAELFHGQTAAFKDMALSILPRFMTYSLKKKQEDREVMILAATSGDTGKAALEGFKNVPGTSIKVFYPIDGVSKIQKQQMVTTTGDNVEVTGITGNFDDAQRAVKEAFASKELQSLCDQHHVFLSSANSINVGRLIPQIVYYFYSYLTLVKNDIIKLGDKVNFTVPSGNFGNCLAGWIGKQMGLPVNKFIVASNKNNILTDFFKTGIYDTRRQFYKTNAPAMDILISSNLERLVYYMTDGNTKLVREYMQGLNDTGIYQVDEKTLETIQRQFVAGCLNEEDVIKTIGECFNEDRYLLDTHTAVGYGVYQEYHKKTNDPTPTILLSTASPYKFPEAVYQAISGKDADVYQAIDAIYELTKVPVPKPLQNIKERPVLHKQVISRDDILKFIAKRIEEA